MGNFSRMPDRRVNIAVLAIITVFLFGGRLFTLSAAAAGKTDSRDISILKVYPEPDSTGVSRNTLIYAKFDREVRESYLNIFTVFMKDSSGESVYGKIKYVAGKATVYFIPRTTLDPGLKYTMTVKGHVEDGQGASLGRDMVWNFTVGGAAHSSAATQVSESTPGPAEETSEPSIASQTVLQDMNASVKGQVDVYSEGVKSSSLSRIEEKRKQRFDELRRKIMSDIQGQSGQAELDRELESAAAVVSGITGSRPELNTASQRPENISLSLDASAQKNKAEFLRNLSEFEKLQDSSDLGSKVLINVNDILNIRVYNALGYLEVEQDVAVYTDGCITFPMVGAVKAAGLTASALAAAMRVPIERDYLNSPRVEIRFKGVASAREMISVYVLGQVKNPGVHSLNKGTRLLAAIVGVNGTTAAADLENAALKRGSREIGINLSALIFNGDRDYDLELHDGDTVFIPETKKKRQSIYVLGKVRYPSRYKFEEGMTAVDALALSEGLSDEINDVQVVRGDRNSPEVINLDMYSIIRKGEISKDVPLQPGDIVYVQSTQKISRFDYVYIFSGNLDYGNNAFQGRYNFSEGMTLLDVIALIKGIPNDLKWVHIIRPDREPIFVDLRDILNRGRLDRDVVLERGDVIYFAPIKYRNIVSRFGSFLGRTVIPTLTTLHSVWDSRKFQ